MTAEQHAPQDDGPMLHLAGFDGPLDLLLDLAQRQRIDWGRVSVLALAEQFVAALQQAQARVPLERRADWLIMAARLVQLRSRLLLAQTPAEAAAAQAEANKALQRLDALATVHAAARWLASRPQLGTDVFARPQAGPSRAAGYMALMEACLVLLQDRGSAPAADRLVESRPAPDLWRVADALSRIQALLAASPAGGDLLGFLPGFAPDHPALYRAACGAVASSLVAALELARSGTAVLEQEASFSPVMLRAAEA